MVLSYHLPNLCCVDCLQINRHGRILWENEEPEKRTWASIDLRQDIAKADSKAVGSDCGREGEKSRWESIANNSVLVLPRVRCKGCIKAQYTVTEVPRIGLAQTRHRNRIVPVVRCWQRGRCLLSASHIGKKTCIRLLTIYLDTILLSNSSNNKLGLSYAKLSQVRSYSHS